MVEAAVAAAVAATVAIILVGMSDSSTGDVGAVLNPPLTLSSRDDEDIEEGVMVLSNARFLEEEIE